MRRLATALVVFGILAVILRTLPPTDNADEASAVGRAIPPEETDDTVSRTSDFPNAAESVAQQNREPRATHVLATEHVDSSADNASPARQAQATAGNEVDQRDNFDAGAVSRPASAASSRETFVPTFWVLGSSTFSTSVAEFVEYSSDFERVWQGGAGVSIRAIRPIDQSATAGIVQLASAIPYQGTRVRYSGYLQAASRNPTAPASAMIWIRADDATGRVVAFQNTLGRLRFEGVGWQQASIVIDIPRGARTLYYGASLVGYGEAWVDSLSIEKASNDTPTSARPYSAVTYNPVPQASRVLAEPVNLDFEQYQALEPQR